MSKISNTIKARYDAGVSNQRKDRSAVALPVIFDDYNGKLRDDNLTCSLTSNCGGVRKGTGKK